MKSGLEYVGRKMGNSFGLAFALAGSLSALTLGATTNSSYAALGPQNLERQEQKCITYGAKAAFKVVSTASKDSFDCFRDSYKGNLPGTVDECLAEESERLLKSYEIAEKTEQRFCDPAPAVGYSSSSALNKASKNQNQKIIEGVFGGDVDAVLSTDRDEYNCQAAILKDLSRVQSSIGKDFYKCVGSDVSDGVASRTSLEQCIGDFSSKTGKMFNRLLNEFNGKYCGDKDLSALFPGHVSSGQDVLDDTLANVLCYTCESTNTSFSLRKNCDLYDNGIEDGSCGIPDKGQLFISSDEGEGLEICQRDGDTGEIIDGTCTSRESGTSLKRAAGSVFTYDSIMFDCNGDDHLDIFIARSTTDTVAVADGLGDYLPAVDFDSSSGFSRGFAIGDFDNNGTTDVYTARGSGTGEVDRICLSNGDCTFNCSDTSLSDYSTGATVRDFNKDGNLDVVISTSIGEYSRFLKGQGDGTFLLSQSIFTDGFATGIDSGLVDLDNSYDVAFSQKGGGNNKICIFNSSTGIFDSCSSISSDAFSDEDIVLADFNRDNCLDAGIARIGYESVYYPGNCDGTFNSSVSFGNSTNGKNSISIVAGYDGGSDDPSVALGIYVSNNQLCTNVNGSFNCSDISDSLSTSVGATFGEVRDLAVDCNILIDDVSATTSDVIYANINGGANDSCEVDLKVDDGSWAEVSGSPFTLDSNGNYTLDVSSGVSGVYNYRTICTDSNSSVCSSKTDTVTISTP